MIMTEKDIEFKTNYFTPGKEDFSVADIDLWKDECTRFRNTAIIRALNNRIIKKINDNVNGGDTNDGVIREYIAIEMKLPDEVINEFRTRGFRVSEDKRYQEEEIISGNSSPDYIEKAVYMTVIAWDNNKYIKDNKKQ